MKAACLAILVVALAGCSPPVRHFGPGKILQINWRTFEVVAQSDDGYIVSFLRACNQSAFPFWEGYEFQYIQYGVETDMGHPICTEYYGSMRRGSTP